MTILFFGSIFVLSIVILVDEFYFHWKRNLPRWERLGHPVDTFSLLVPIGILAFIEKDAFSESVYVISSIISCLCITKDEWVHARFSSATESWLHSLLFILHPTILMSGYFIWDQNLILVRLFFFATLSFGIYQLVFWNLYADRVFGEPQAGRQ